MTYNIVKVPRAILLTCLKCPLCHNLVHEATTISECLHTFCRDCIYQELDEEDSDCCPVCNVNLGGSPLEKLRADRQLDDVCSKIFPSKPKKRKLVDEDVDHDAPAPAKRKERSLSSLGIGVPSSTNPGYVKRKTKSVTRKSSIATSTDSESEDGKSDTAKSGADSEDHPERRSLHGTGHSDGALSEDHKKPVKAEPASDEEQEMTEAKLVRKIEQLASSRKVMLSGEQMKAQSSRIASKGRAKGGISQTASHKARGAGFIEEHRDTDDYDGTDRRLPIAFSVVRERSGKGMKRGGSALAQLAEIAVDQSVKEMEPPPKFVPRAPRGRGPLESSKSSVLADSLKPTLQEKASHTIATPPPFPSGPPLLFKSVPTVPVAKTVASSLVKHDMASTSLSKQEEKNAGFWFVLQAVDSQIGNGSLPQLSARYLRIKDGRLPISVVKKYLMKKLHLNNENEVEIRCRGQLVVPNLPLESVRNIWFASMVPSSLLPSMKERSCKSSEDYLMVLTYGRHRASM